jgi:hypothetical protein
LASSFPGAQDFVLTSIGGHDADTYLGDVAVAGLVADALYPSTQVALAPGTDTAVRMNEAEASVLLVELFAEAVARNIKDDERATVMGSTRFAKTGPTQ